MPKPNATLPADSPRTTQVSPPHPSAFGPLLSPRLILPLGRGARGKSLWSLWYLDRNAQAGSAITIADGDRTNQSLRARFPDALKPETASDPAVLAWIRTLIETQIQSRTNLLLDLGGGDLLLKRTARDMQLLEWLTEMGIEVIAVHLLGPSVDDLAYLEEVEEGGLLAPPRTLIVLNEGVVPADRDPVTAFKSTITKNPIFLRALERGAQVVTMPHLSAAPEIDARRLRFATAQSHLGAWDAQATRIWLRRMEETHRDVLDWLAR